MKIFYQMWKSVYIVVGIILFVNFTIDIPHAYATNLVVTGSDIADNENKKLFANILIDTDSIQYAYSPSRKCQVFCVNVPASVLLS